MTSIITVSEHPTASKSFIFMHCILSDQFDNRDSEKIKGEPRAGQDFARCSLQALHLPFRRMEDLFSKRQK